MQRSGRVLHDVVTGEMASVEIQSASQCARCARGQGCGAGIFNQGVAAVQLSCLSDCVVRAGDEVVVEFEDDESSHWLYLVMVAYGLPTAGLLLTVVAASLLLQHLPQLAALSAAHQDLLLAIAALVGLAGGVFAWRMLAPDLLRRTDAGRCLQSGRIVAVSNDSPLRTPVLRAQPHVREETR